MSFKFCLIYFFTINMFTSYIWRGSFNFYPYFSISISNLPIVKLFPFPVPFCFTEQYWFYYFHTSTLSHPLTFYHTMNLPTHMVETHLKSCVIIPILSIRIKNVWFSNIYFVIIWCQINRKNVITIPIWFDLTKFRSTSLCVLECIPKAGTFYIAIKILIDVWFYL